MANLKRLPKLIEELAAAQLEYDRLAFDEEENHRRAGPCSASQLATLERSFGKPLPPSYRAFLELHNGWEGFRGPAKLLAAEDQQQPWVKERMQSIKDLCNEFGDKDPFAGGALPILLSPRIKTFVVIDPRKVRADGEMDLVEYELTSEQERYKDFVAYLEEELAGTQRLIAEEREGIDDEDDEEDEGEEDEEEDE